MIKYSRQFCWFTQQSFAHSYFCKVSVPCWSLWGLTGDESFSKLLMLLKHISMPRHRTHCFVFSPRCVCYVLLSPINFEMPALVLTILCDWLIVDGTPCSTHLCMHINASLLQSFTVCSKYSLQTKPSMLLRNIPLMSDDSKLYHLTVTAGLVEYSVLWTTEKPFIVNIVQGEASYSESKYIYIQLETCGLEWSTLVGTIIALFQHNNQNKMSKCCDLSFF